MYVSGLASITGQNGTKMGHKIDIEQYVSVDDSSSFWGTI
jgi:hypothetical protein